jgi:hypothetical protein
MTISEIAKQLDAAAADVISKQDIVNKLNSQQGSASAELSNAVQKVRDLRSTLETELDKITGTSTGRVRQVA